MFYLQSIPLKRRSIQYQKQILAMKTKGDIMRPAVEPRVQIMRIMANRDIIKDINHTRGLGQQSTAAAIGGMRGMVGAAVIGAAGGDITIVTEAVSISGSRASLSPLSRSSTAWESDTIAIRTVIATISFILMEPVIRMMLKSAIVPRGFYAFRQ
jgi:hypothetical protein